MKSESEIAKHIAALSEDAKDDIKNGRWDEVMTDALYDACGAETQEEMSRARQIATEALKRYSEYTARIISDPSYYGSECSATDAAEITKRLTAMIEGEFPGINVRVWNETIGANTATRGPEQSVCDEIDQWISENWTAAL